jgi:hypothetical protein
MQPLGRFPAFYGTLVLLLFPFGAMVLDVTNKRAVLSVKPPPHVKLIHLPGRTLQGGRGLRQNSAVEI